MKALPLTLLALAALTGCCGPIIQDGAFDTGTPWELLQPATVGAGAVELTSNQNALGGIQQTIFVLDPGPYRLSFDVVATSAAEVSLALGGDFKRGFTAGPGHQVLQVDIDEPGNYVFKLGVTSASLGETVTLDNIALRPFDIPEVLGWNLCDYAE